MAANRGRSEFSVTPGTFQEFAPVLSDLVTDAIKFSAKLGDEFLDC